VGGRGRKHLKEGRQLLLQLVDEAVAAGARQSKACEQLALSERTLQRWRLDEQQEDRRKGPKTAPRNKLSPEEREALLSVANSPLYRDLSPKQIVPTLADNGEYIASESTFYRVLREEKQMKHRQSSRPSKHKKPTGYVSRGPNEVWSWDITYLRGPARGSFYYLYMVVDVWSRKIVGFEVHESECMELSSRLIRKICWEQKIEPGQVVLHSDNGGPMRGSTMKAMLEALGVAASYSRPSVSNDNPYSESLFRTLKYRPEYPSQPFNSLKQAESWVERFVKWYNEEHLHSSIGFLSPKQRHEGEGEEVLKKRREVYEQARRERPERWSGDSRKWEQPKEVRLNEPGEEDDTKRAKETQPTKKQKSSNSQARQHRPRPSPRRGGEGRADERRESPSLKA